VSKIAENRETVIHACRERAKRSDFKVSLFNPFSPFGFNLRAWRSGVVRALNLKWGNEAARLNRYMTYLLHPLSLLSLLAYESIRRLIAQVGSSRLKRPDFWLEQCAKSALELSALNFNSGRAPGERCG
jgi:hypothetical protein